MRHGSLFSGIGGFDLAAEWMGWENVFHCEWNEFGQKVLKHYWPEAISLGDIHKAKFKRDERGNVYVRMDGIMAHDNGIIRGDGRNAEPGVEPRHGKSTTRDNDRQKEETEWLPIGPIDIITGGFPCQPYSMAGKRKGKEDDRHLWPQMLRVIREIKPRWVVGENVSGIISWNGGMVFNEVQADLEAEGYEVQAYVLPAVSVNAPHRRDRVWFVAHRNEFGQSRHGYEIGSWESVDNGDGELCLRTQQGRYEVRCLNKRVIEGRTTPHTEPTGREGYIGTRKPIRFEPGTWDNWPTVEPTIRSKHDGLSPELAGITVSKHRNESIKAYGNAIVPYVAYQIFKAIEAYERRTNHLPDPL